jgi:hypothetical protein
MPRSLVSVSGQCVCVCSFQVNPRRRRVTTHSPLSSSARFLVEPLYPRCTAVQQWRLMATRSSSPTGMQLDEGKPFVWRSALQAFHSPMSASSHLQVRPTALHCTDACSASTSFPARGPSESPPSPAAPVAGGASPCFHRCVHQGQAHCTALRARPPPPHTPPTSLRCGVPFALC